MPTGYTEIIERDTEPTFEEYLWRCVRAFGYCMHLRDTPLDEKLTEELLMQRPSMLSYYRNRAAEAQEEYDKWYSLTPEDQLEWAKQHKEESLKSYKEIQERNILLWTRYQKMRQQVQSWKPPTSEHDGLKKFMIEQIDLSTRHRDPNDADSFTLKAMKELEATPLDALVMQRTMQLLRDASYYLTEVSKFEQTEKEGKKWITDLLKSVPLPT